MVDDDEGQMDVWMDGGGESCGQLQEQVGLDRGAGQLAMICTL